jgi:hypothetical protein
MKADSKHVLSALSKEVDRLSGIIMRAHATINDKKVPAVTRQRVASNVIGIQLTIDGLIGLMSDIEEQEEDVI